ncbi:MAG: hypothetical protein V3V71_16640, partial [Roseateles sp.]
MRSPAMTISDLDDGVSTTEPPTTALAAALATALATGPVGAPVCDEAAAAPGANPRAASPGDDAGRSPCHPNTTTRPS